jgi:putative peptide zinc metalloprotease protein
MSAAAPLTESLYSPHWWRVAGLHPRLRAQVNARRQVSRGRVGYVLYGPGGRRLLRLNAAAWELAGRLDGRLSLDELWRALLAAQGDDAPTQGEVLRVLARLTDAGLVQAEARPDLVRIDAAQRERQGRQRRARLNPLAFRVGLFDPSALLQRLQPLGRLLFSRWAGWLWLLLVGAGAAVAASHAPELAAHAAQHLGSPGQLLLMALCYPLMKALHELAHGLALRRLGCEVPEVGINLLVLVPLPYVDASASLALGSRWQRALVAAAGMAVELGLAAAAALAWVLMEDSLPRDIALAVMLLGGASTLLFNGNPLLRFDGYHVLCDALDLPELGPRSDRHVGGALRRGLLRACGAALPEPAEPPPADRLEAWALRLYAPLAAAWRLALGALLVVWAAEVSGALALVLALGTAWGAVLRPAWRAWQALQAEGGLQPRRVRWRLHGALAAALGGVLVAVAVVPWPAGVVTQGVAWPGEQAELRAATEGEIVTLHAADGQRVRRGQPLLELAAPELQARRAAAQARLDAALARRHAAWMTDPAQARAAEEDAATQAATLAELDREREGLTVRARVDGVLVLPAQADLPHRLVAKGDVLGYVLDERRAGVRAVVDERDAGLLRAGVQAAWVRLDDGHGPALPARIAREVPAATDELPSEVLAAGSGGAFATDPQHGYGRRTLRPVVVVDLTLPDDAIRRIGGRVAVRFELPPRTLAERAALRLRQVFLRQVGGG